MKIYDISQEVFGCVVFPGDPAPERIALKRIGNGDVCNLTALSMCAHNGTHVDAPYHFIKDGKTIDEVSLDRWIGYAYVAAHHGPVSAQDAEEMLRRAKEAAQGYRDAHRAGEAGTSGAACDAHLRILMKGKAYLTNEAAEVFAAHRILLFGNESQTVGPEDAPRQVHLTLLGAQVVLLEGIRLEEVPEGVYFLQAAPINLGGADGAPCRATLIDWEDR
ncbi:MAG: cyclase family protein [Lachnospiraceae bacterium]|nr:cyclase family protein [Lachnospiraceae bacterium]